MIRPMKEVLAIKKILRRITVRRAAMTGISLLNLNLSKRAPATNLDKQFIIPLTPATKQLNYLLNTISILTH